MIDLTAVARVCHEANRAIQVATLEQDVSPYFDDAPTWQFDSAIEGVKAALEGQTSEQLHESWCRYKIEDGWVYGPVKDAEAKTHPCLVPYAELPVEQRLKDAVFRGIVAAFTETYEEN